jgi:spore germination protein GerM
VKKKPSNAKGILLLAFVVFAVVVGALVFRKYETATRKVEQPPQAAPAGTVVVTLFFASAEGDKLVREGREVDIEESVEDSVESVVDELIRGPLGNLAPTLPPNARVLGVHLKGDVAQLDFGPELQEGIPEGSSAEMVAVYSIVDTVATNFPQVKAVQFLVNGAVPETLKGHLDLRMPLVPDFELEQKK